jgi:hypothetical protein
VQLNLKIHTIKHTGTGETGYQIVCTNEKALDNSIITIIPANFSSFKIGQDNVFIRSKQEEKTNKDDCIVS